MALKSSAKLNNTLAQMLIKQIGSEYQNYFLYLQCAINCDNMGLMGIKKWFYGKAMEEISHAQYIIEYLNARDVEYILPASIQTKSNVKVESIVDMFKEGYKAEVETSNMINMIYEEAKSTTDPMTVKMLDKLIIEQVEEQDLFSTALSYITAGDFNNNIYEIDDKLSKQEFHPIVEMDEYFMVK